MRSRRKYQWESLSDDELLDLRFCDLGLNIDKSVLNERIDQLYLDLERKNISFYPHCWLAEEWFSPDGIPGIAIPFYLATPRLAKLEFRQMYQIEGGTPRWCMQLLRHEAGHAIDTAYRLHRRKRWREIFGLRSKTYPNFYIPKPKSKKYVYHLDWWYAQSHPSEDFAETFAIWLTPRSNWRKIYADWPVIKKLEYIDELMGTIQGVKPPVRSRCHVDSLRNNRRTLRQHYEEKRDHYGTNIPEVFDGELMRLFPDHSEYEMRRKSAAAFLQKMQPQISQICARSIGDQPYVVAQVLQDMIIRCREMKLYITRPEEEVKIEVAIFISLHVTNYLHKYKHRIAV